VQYDGEPVRSAIISAGSEPATHSTLAGALNSLWNSVHAVKEGGTVVLLAEAREGLGGGALQAFVEGRLKPEQLAALQAPQYTEGLEHLLYLQELRQKRELGLVSSLPHYYSSRLGFATYSGVKDAHDKMLARHGRGHKELVISDADAVLVRTAA
jgi:nickel-dependent lactate racemase